MIDYKGEKTDVTNVFVDLLYFFTCVHIVDHEDVDISDLIESGKTKQFEPIWPKIQSLAWKQEENISDKGAYEVNCKPLFKVS